MSRRLAQKNFILLVRYHINKRFAIISIVPQLSPHPFAKPMAELLYDDTHHSAVTVIDDLLHGLLQFDLALLVDHGNLACDAVID